MFSVDLTDLKILDAKFLASVARLLRVPPPGLGSGALVYFHAYGNFTFASVESMLIWPLDSRLSRYFIVNYWLVGTPRQECSSLI